MNRFICFKVLIYPFLGALIVFCPVLFCHSSKLTCEIIDKINNKKKSFHNQLPLFCLDVVTIARTDQEIKMQTNKKMINFYEKKTSKVVDLGCLLLLVSNSTANTAGL